MVNDLESSINITDKSGKITNYFINDTGDGKFLDFTKVKINSIGYDEEKISKTDLLGISLGIPIFSKKAKDKLEEILLDEIEFFESELNINQNNIICFSGKIKKKVELIDKNKSRFRTSTTGSQFLIKPILKENIEMDFYIAKDKDFPSYFYVSEKFIDLITENILKIKYSTP